MANVMCKARNNSDAKWDIALFENMANDIDEGDASLGSNYSHSLSDKLNKLSRSYLVSARIENGIQ